MVPHKAYPICRRAVSIVNIHSQPAVNGELTYEQGQDDHPPDAVISDLFGLQPFGIEKPNQCPAGGIKSDFERRAEDMKPHKHQVGYVSRKHPHGKGCETHELHEFPAELKGFLRRRNRLVLPGIGCAFGETTKISKRTIGEQVKQADKTGRERENRPQ